MFIHERDNQFTISNNELDKQISSTGLLVNSFSSEYKYAEAINEDLFLSILSRKIVTKFLTYIKDTKHENLVSASIHGKYGKKNVIFTFGRVFEDEEERYLNGYILA